MAFPKAIESNSSDYQGTMQAEPFEITPPGVLVTSRIIRNDQSWGIKVDWEMHGNVVEFLDAEFRVRVLLESMGPGTEYDLPSAGPVIVGTLSVTPTYPGGVPTRTYTANIDLAPGSVEVGTYLVVTVIQMYERSTGNPTPIAGFVDGPMIQVFKPGP